MNTLSQDVEIRGSITFAQQLTIEGKVEGDVVSAGDLTIGEGALVKGEIKTRSVVICGTVEGNVTVQERCQARSTAVIHGDITAGTFAADAGASFMGRSRVGKAAVAAAAGSDERIRVQAWRDGTAIVVEVENAAASGPGGVVFHSEQDPLRGYGQGLLIVTAYTDSVEVIPPQGQGGLVVRCRKEIEVLA